MANSLQQNPLYIDTPSATPIINTAIKIKHIEFVGFSGASDSAVVKNKFGHIVSELSGATSGGEGAVRTGTIGWVDGLAVTTLTSGAVLVFFE